MEVLILVSIGWGKRWDGPDGRLTITPFFLGMFFPLLENFASFLPVSIIQLTVTRSSRKETAIIGGTVGASLETEDRAESSLQPMGVGIQSSFHHSPFYHHLSFGSRIGHIQMPMKPSSRVRHNIHQDYNIKGTSVRPALSSPFRHISVCRGRHC